MTEADLAKAPYISLSTFRQSGVSVDTPVWVAEHDGRGYIFSAPDAGKVKRIRNNPRVRIAVCDMRGRLLGDWSEAKARLVNDPAEIAAMYPAFARKYGLLMRITNLLSRLTGRYQRRQIIAVELD